MSKLSISYRILDKGFIEEFGIPKYGTPHAAGIDLRANIQTQELILAPGETSLINTGIALFIKDANYAGFIYPRSGLGHNQGIVLGNLVGVIDADYQGEIKVSLWNRSNHPQIIQRGDRIAQLVIQKITQVDLQLVEDFPTTDRGKGGFGSTGLK